jgi:Rab-GTPase-TBC domain/PH domain
MAARAQKFWADFATNADELKESSTFSLFLWSGISSDGNVRKQIWSNVAKQHKQDEPALVYALQGNGTRSLPQYCVQEIDDNVDVELDQACNTPLLSSSVWQHVILATGGDPTTELSSDSAYEDQKSSPTVAPLAVTEAIRRILRTAYIASRRKHELFVTSATGRTSTTSSTDSAPKADGSSANDIPEYDFMSWYTSGYAQLALIIFSVVRNEAHAAILLYVLHTRMHAFREDENLHLLNDVLVLADMVVQQLPQLAAHLNESQVDVIDLSQLFVSWALPLFASYYPSGAVIRVVDIMLFEDPSCLAAVAFGVLKFFSGMLVTQPAEEVFRALVDIPSSDFPESTVKDVFMAGYEVFRNNQTNIEELRAEKDWLQLIEYPGTVEFIRGVGNPELHQRLHAQAELSSHLGDILDVPPSAAESKASAGSAGAAGIQARLGYGVQLGMSVGGTGLPSSEALRSASQRGSLVTKVSNVGGLADNGDIGKHSDAALSEPPLFRIVTPADERAEQQADTLTKLEKERARLPFDDPTRRVLEAALREIRLQAEKMVHLESELTNMQNDEKYNMSQSEAVSGVESSYESDRHSASGTEDWSTANEFESPRGGRSGSRSGASPEPQAGFIRHSKLYQHQQFPCLYMEGYLLKARQSVTKRREAFPLHRRFFVLQGSFLSYHKSHRSPTPVKDVCVDMRGRKVAKLDKKFGKYGFTISTLDADQPYLMLFASSGDERNVWIQVLSAATEA